MDIELFVPPGASKYVEMNKEFGYSAAIGRGSKWKKYRPGHRNPGTGLATLDQAPSLLPTLTYVPTLKALCQTVLNQMRDKQREREQIQAFYKEIGVHPSTATPRTVPYIDQFKESNQHRSQNKHKQPYPR